MIKYTINYIATRIYIIIGIIIRTMEYMIIGVRLYDRIWRMDIKNAYEWAKDEYRGSYYNLYDRLKMLFIVKCRTIEFDDNTIKQIIILKNYIRIAKNMKHGKIVSISCKRIWKEDELLWGFKRLYIVQILFLKNYGIAIGV